MINVSVRWLLCMAYYLCIVWPTQAQDQPPGNCGADQVLRADSLTRKLLALFNQNILAHQTNKASLDLTTVYTIPVVVHVYHLGEAVGTGSNVSTASVQAAIDAMNQSFRAQGAFSGSQDVKIQFVLATRTPNCQATNGIVRVDARSITGYQVNGCSTTDEPMQNNLRTLSSWSRDSYVNIGVVHKMPDAAGFAWFLNDLFIPAQYANGSQGALWGHEMGHAFNLYHTFEGDNGGTQCPVNTNPTTDGDRIGDTDPHKASDGCSTYSPTSINPCIGVAFGTLLQNIMSYSACKTRFTLSQVERMRYALLFSRTGLINSYGKVPPVAGETSPTAACVVSAPNGASAYFGINTFTLN
ncbi:MAG: hypothetical protein LH609_15815, partial [Rudanella sp.]|nr:hypothetical protein [Rudanella sp.]